MSCWAWPGCWGCQTEPRWRGLRPSGLWKVTQRELLDVARLLGLTKVSRLNKQALLARVWETLERMGAIAPNGATESMPAPRPTAAGQASGAAGPGRRADGARAAVGAAVGPDRRRGRPADLGATRRRSRRRRRPPPPTSSTWARRPTRDPARVRALAEAHIPWSYGRDRVTAMPVDPDRLYVYWEVTDEAMARARAGLGPGGAEAWLSLRVYDVTGRLFDGTNAHSYFDNRIERGDRQWFFQVGKPTSHVVIDIGMKSHEGYFTKIARSGRVEFPAPRAGPLERAGVDDRAGLDRRDRRRPLTACRGGPPGRRPAGRRRGGRRARPGAGRPSARTSSPASAGGMWEGRLARAGRRARGARDLGRGAADRALRPR